MRHQINCVHDLNKLGEKNMNCFKKFGFIAAIMIAAVSLSGVSAFAQDEGFKLGVVLGLETSKTVGETTTKSTAATSTRKFSETSTAPWKLGVVGEFHLTESFALESGLIFKQISYSKKSEYTTGTGTLDKFSSGISYLEIPINAKFYHPITDDLKIFGFVGPYIDLGLSGKEKEEYDDGTRKETTEKNLFSDDLKQAGDDAYSRAGFGLSFGAGMAYGKIFWSAQYSLGLSNLYKKSKIQDTSSNYEWEQTLKHRNFGVTVGYMF